MPYETVMRYVNVGEKPRP